MIDILIVDEILLVCEVIAAALEDEDEIHSTGVATTFEQAIESLNKSTFNMVLISTNLPQGHTLKLVECVSAEYSDTKSIVLGIADSEPVILRYIEAGASGYLFKEDPVDEMLKNVRAVYYDRALVSPKIAASLIERLAQFSAQLKDLGTDLDVYEDLTTREKEVLDLIAEGLTNQQIAEKITVELGTVKNHVHNILDKLNVSSRKEAAKYLALIQAEEEIDKGCE